MIWLKALLFFLLSPGVLLTIPPGSGGLWMSRQTSLIAAAVHAVVFVVVLHYAYGWMRSYEGFQGFEGVQRNTVIGKCFEDGYCAGNVNCKAPGQRCNPVTMQCQEQIMIPSSIVGIYDTSGLKGLT